MKGTGDTMIVATDWEATILCDNRPCRASLTMQLVEGQTPTLARLPEMAVRSYGWTVTDDDRHYCPDHQPTSGPRRKPTR